MPTGIRRCLNVGLELPLKGEGVLKKKGGGTFGKGVLEGFHAMDLV